MTRYASIWFPYLLCEYAARKNPALREVPFVLASAKRGRTIVESVNQFAMQKGIRPGMVLADCKALYPELQTLKSEPARAEKVLQALALWTIRFTPIASIDLPDGLILDTSGCSHLWGGETQYLENIKTKLEAFGYTVKMSIADTVGAAWAVARFGTHPIVNPGGQKNTLQDLPPAALRLEPEVLARLKKLGLERIGSFSQMPKSALRRRFGASLPLRIGQAVGDELEMIVAVKPVEPYQQRLCCPELISSATAIRIALEQLLKILCQRLEDEGLGLRHAVFKGFRVDGNIQQIEIGTGHPSRNASHLFRLFEHKITTLEPGMGIELFLLEAPKVEPVENVQEAIWNVAAHNSVKVAELLDRISVRTGSRAIRRYLPSAHYWPESSVREAMPLWEKPISEWRTDLPRPVHLLEIPEIIEVTAVLPDYPPMLFRYKGELFTIVKSDGPERIEHQWWLGDELYRDYYCVEDLDGARYWLFRSGPYDKQKPKWFLHGFYS